MDKAPLNKISALFVQLDPCPIKTVRAVEAMRDMPGVLSANKILHVSACGLTERSDTVLVTARDRFQLAAVSKELAHMSAVRKVRTMPEIAEIAPISCDTDQQEKTAPRPQSLNACRY